MSLPPISKTGPKPISDWVQEHREKVIQEVALPAIKDACVGLVFSLVTVPFVATPFGLATLGICPIIVTGVNAFFRTYLLYSETEKIDLMGFEKLLSFAPALSFGVLDITTRQVLIHEGGHYVTLKLFYKYVQPTIEIFPFVGGVTRYKNTKILTELGQKLGAEKARAVVSAAGTLATTTFNLPAIVFGHFYGGQFGMYLQTSAFLSAMSDAIYALEALFPGNHAGSDFAKLQKFGIHPLTAAMTVLLIPLTLKGMLLLIDQLRHDDRSGSPVQVA